MRYFCDICDVFDLHDTEDCPTQCSDNNGNGNGGSKHHGVRGEDRPYCTICESKLIFVNFHIKRKSNQNKEK